MSKKLSEASAFETLNPQVQAEIIRRNTTRAAVPALQNLLLTAAAGGAGIAAIQRFARMRKEQEAAKKEENKPAVRVFKSANEGGVVSNLADRIAQIATDISKGQFAQRPYQLPWFPTAAALTATGGLAGGYLAADRGIFRPLEKANQDREREQAREEYQQALEAFLTSKQSGEETGGGERCKLARDFDSMEKSLTADNQKLSYDDGADFARLGSSLLGVYLLAMGGAGVGGLYKGYKDKQRASKTRAAEQAVLERKLMNRPRVRPVVVPLQSQKPQEDGEEETTPSAY